MSGNGVSVQSSEIRPDECSAVFAQVMAPVSAIFQQVEVPLAQALLLRDKVLALCNKLGTLVNCEKPHLIPSQEAAYLRMWLDSATLKAFSTEKRIQALLKGVGEVPVFLPPAGSGAATSVGSHVMADSASARVLASYGGLLSWLSITLETIRMSQS